jgi:hypothetical protein
MLVFVDDPLFNFDARLPCEIRESVAGRKSVEPTFESDSFVIDICKYLFFVLCILLIMDTRGIRESIGDGF